MIKCQITCKSLQKSFKCQNFLRVWHFLGRTSKKNHPVSLVKGYKTENPQQLNLTKTCGQAKSFASSKYVNYPIAMDWCQLQLFRALIEIQMYKSDGFGMGATDQEAINCMHLCTFF